MKIAVKDPHNVISSASVQKPDNNAIVTLIVIINARERGTEFNYVGGDTTYVHETTLSYSALKVKDDGQYCLASITIIAESEEEIQMLKSHTNKTVDVEKDQMVSYLINFRNLGKSTAIATYKTE